MPVISRHGVSLAAWRLPPASVLVSGASPVGVVNALDPPSRGPQSLEHDRLEQAVLADVLDELAELRALDFQQREEGGGRVGVEGVKGIPLRCWCTGCDNARCHTATTKTALCGKLQPATGRDRVKSEPPPGLAAAVRVPRWASAMARDRCRPRPKPKGAACNPSGSRVKG